LTSLPRSLLLYNFGSGRKLKEADYHPHLLVGLADGTVVSFNFRDNNLQEKKIFALGTAPVSFSTCKVDGRTAIFASGSRASVLYWERQRLHQSPVMLKDMARGTNINSPAFPSCLVLATPSRLTIGNVRGVDKMQIKSIPLGLDNPRRITHHPALKVFGVACVSTAPPRIGEAEERLSSFKLIDDITFSHLGSFVCEADEEIVATLTLPNADTGRPCFCVGTVQIHPEEREPSSGRILLFSFGPTEGSASSSTPSLKLVTATPVSGCVYQLAFINGLIAAAVNSSVRRL